MVFSSEEEAYKFYKNYATKMGFRVRRGKTQWLTDGTIRKRYIYCSAQGFRSENKSGKARKYQRKETRIGCDAMVQFTHDKDSGKWEITRIVLEHNHDTNAPNQRNNACPSPNSLKEDAIVTPILKAGMMKGTGVANSPESFPCVNHSNSYLSNEKTNILPPEHSQSLVNFADHLQWEDPTADQSQGQSSSFSCRLVLKALKVITRSEALEGSHKIVEKYLDMALEEVENVSKVKMTGHIDGNDAEIHKKNGGSNGIDCMETQWKVPNPPCSSKKESCDDAIIHCRPLREERTGPRVRSGSRHWVGETSRQQPCNPAEIIMGERKDEYLRPKRRWRERLRELELARERLHELARELQLEHARELQLEFHRELQLEQLSVSLSVCVRMSLSLSVRVLSMTHTVENVEDDPVERVEREHAERVEDENETTPVFLKVEQFWNLMIE